MIIISKQWLRTWPQFNYSEGLWNTEIEYYKKKQEVLKEQLSRIYHQKFEHRNDIIC